MVSRSRAFTRSRRKFFGSIGKIGKTLVIFPDRVGQVILASKYKPMFSSKGYALLNTDRVLIRPQPAGASCLQTLGDAAGALPLYRRALESRERVLGPEHPKTLTSVNDLAVCIYALGDAAGALPLYRRVLESQERVLGPEHPTTQTLRRNLEIVTRTATP